MQTMQTIQIEHSCGHIVSKKIDPNNPVIARVIYIMQSMPCQQCNVLDTLPAPKYLRKSSSPYIAAAYTIWDWIRVFVCRQPLPWEIYPVNYGAAYAKYTHLIVHFQYSSSLHNYSNDRLIPQSFLSLGLRPQAGAVDVTYTLPHAYAPTDKINRYEDVVQTIELVSSHPVLRHLVHKKALLDAAADYRDLFLKNGENQE